jgi:hypothetical protein
MPVKVTNATAIYTVMLLLLVAGMWAILAYGATLQAPPDLAGEWDLIPEEARQANGHRPVHATIDQSGRFVRLKVAGKPAIDLRIVSDTSPEQVNATGGAQVIRLTSPDGDARFESTAAPDVYRVSLSSPQAEATRYTARILTRAHPRPTASAIVQAASTAPTTQHAP